jgi:23S rRNA pseudouridine1911/1915/1917 synthase
LDKKRLDLLVAKKLGVSRSSAVNLIESGKVKIGSKIIDKPSTKVLESSRINVKESSEPQPAALNLPIIYEDDNCVVIDKPAGILAHSKGAFSSEQTVASWLLPKTTGFEKDNNRAGIVHRLDRGTSGVMLCAKNPQTLSLFQKQFSSRKVKKTYNAIIAGAIVPAEAVIDIPIERNPKDPKRFRAGHNGKPAKTTYKVKGSFKFNGEEFSLIELTPKTGRTHQLRVHLAYMKHPIVGDDFYSGKPADRLYLHALSLEITLPGGQRQIFESPLPSSFQKPKI